MALFGGQRDAKFIASINSEVVNTFIDTEIEFYKLLVEESEPNLYGESENKSYYDSILLPSVITKDERVSLHDDYGNTYSRTLQFALTRDILVKSGFYPEIGDVIFWDNEYYELDNIDANQYFAGKNPETWPNGTSHGYSVSIVCEAHATRQTPAGITDLRKGGTNNNHTYKGF